MPELNLVVDGRHELGEGVQWCDRRQRVFWTDIEGARLNDGRCDRQGRFVFGTMDDGPGARRKIGSFYRLDGDLTLTCLPLPKVAIPNSICFSLDGSAMYFCDTVDKLIWRWDGYASGDASALTLFADASAAPGAPDGSAIDADGHLWNAVWGAARVIRYALDGSIARSITVDTTQPSCLCFGGPALNELYVSSAWQQMAPAMRAVEPHAGGLYHGAAGVRGVPEARFGTPPSHPKETDVQA